MPITKEKQDILKYITEKYSDMNLICINTFTKYQWSKEKNILELSNQEIEEVNLRKIFPDEIILDLEDKNQVKQVEDSLAIFNYNYKEWFTGSRGYHFSLIFPELLEFTKKERNLIRKHFIRLFKCDETKSSEDTFLALEGEKHFKTNPENTNNYKVLANTVVGPDNKLKKEWKDLVYEERKKNIQTIYKAEDEFKDFLNHPFMKWALENEIKDGMRNNVLFKNLAVALVKSGLNREKILEYATIIVKNCPGTSINSFMGWVDKVFDGELNEFNHFELVKWAGEYGHPILFDKVEGEKKTEEILSCKELFKNVWNNKPIIAQPVWRNLCFYNMLGTMLDERKDDLRIHIIFTSQTSSGKDEGVDLLKRILDDLDFKTSTPAEITDRTLVGGVNNMIKEVNSKFGLTEENQENGKRKYRNSVEKGQLAHCNWMAIPEAEFVFKPGPHNRMLQTILRQAMDKKRTIEKGVAGEMIDIQTNTSFVITTFPIEDAMSKILHNGLFQRCLYYNKIMTEEDRNEIDKGLRSYKFNKNLRENYNLNKWVGLLEQKLKQIKGWYELNKDKLILYDGIDKYIEDKVIDYKNTYQELSDAEKSLLDAIITRGHNTIEKLIYLNAIYKMSNNITSDDVDETFDLINSCFDSIRLLISSTSNIEKRLAVFLNLLNDGKRSTMEMHDLLKKKLNMKSPNERMNLMKIAKERGYIEMFKESKTTFMKKIQREEF